MTLSPHELSEARDWICGTLSPFLDATPPVAPPDHLWPEIVRLADVWLVAPRLHDRVKDHGLLPADAAEVLGAVSEYATLRADAMRAELEDLIAGFNDAGLEPVVFKGAEWLMGHYAPHARRLISDLDLWFPDSTEQDAAIRVLADLGYRPLTPIEEHDKSRSHHFPPFHRKGAVARLELHHRLIRSTLAASMDLEGAAARLRPTDCNGLRYRRLDPGDALTVAFLQSGRMAIPGFETRKVAVSKWLDFLDRFVLAGRSAISHPADIGIRDCVHPTDIQLLTALKEKFDLPYSGMRDEAYIASWVAARMVEDTLIKSLRRSFTWKNISSPEAWRRFATYLPNRVREVRINKIL
jgi:hypothetical protein